MKESKLDEIKEKKMSYNIAVQRDGEVVYVSTSKADAQEYMNLSRSSLERMLEEGCELQGFTADIAETSISASDKVLEAIQGTITQYQRELEHAQHEFDVAKDTKCNTDKVFREASKILNRKTRQLERYVQGFDDKRLRSEKGD